MNWGERIGWMLVGYLLIRVLGIIFRSILRRYRVIKRWFFEKKHTRKEFIKKTEEKIRILILEEAVIKDNITKARYGKFKRIERRKLLKIRIQLWFFQKVLKNTEYRYLKLRLKTLRARENYLLRRKEDNEKLEDLARVQTSIQEIELFLNVVEKPKKILGKKRKTKNDSSRR